MPLHRYPIDYYPAFDLIASFGTYGRLLITSWYGDYPALEFLGFSTEREI